MTIEEIIEHLEREWDFESGFFGRLRRGHFDPACYDRLIRALDRIETPQTVALNRRMVSLLWYMPIFMHWQQERVQSNGADLIAFERAINHVQGSIERILGVP